MKNRHVYALRDRTTLENALAAARRCGIDDDDLAVVARHDIELQLDPEKTPVHDGTRITGLLAGLSAVTVPFGVSIAGAGLLAQLGDNLASWFPALNADANDDVRAAFHQRVEDGQLLLVVDAPPELHNEVTKVLTAEVGAETLKFADDA
jgi:hypothetical protein